MMLLQMTSAIMLVVSCTAIAPPRTVLGEPHIPVSVGAPQPGSVSMVQAFTHRRAEEGCNHPCAADCDVSECKNGAKCDDKQTTGDATRFKTMDAFQCTCNAGWSGQTCDTSTATKSPTASPQPTKEPTKKPTKELTKEPTTTMHAQRQPTKKPTKQPAAVPTASPTAVPTPTPTTATAAASHARADTTENPVAASNSRALINLLSTELVLTATLIIMVSMISIVVCIIAWKLKQELSSLLGGSGPTAGLKDTPNPAYNLSLSPRRSERPSIGPSEGGGDRESSRSERASEGDDLGARESFLSDYERASERASQGATASFQPSEPTSVRITNSRSSQLEEIS